MASIEIEKFNCGSCCCLKFSARWCIQWLCCGKWVSDEREKNTLQVIFWGAEMATFLFYLKIVANSSGISVYFIKYPQSFTIVKPGTVSLGIN